MPNKAEEAETAEELRVAYEIGDISYLEYLFLLWLLNQDD